MLQQIRDRSQSMIAKIIVGAVVVALALFGIESVVGLFTSGGDDVVEVNGEPITRQQVEMEVQRAIRSGQVPPEQERELRSQVIEQMITLELLDQYAVEGGMTISDQQLDRVIVNREEFQDQSGDFSTELFRNRLASAGYTPLSFRGQLRSDLIRQQVQQGLADSEFLLDSERRRLAELQNQTRSFRYHRLDAEDIEGEIEISEADLQSHYDAQQDEFRRPEQVRLNYVILDQAEMAESVEIDDQALREAYAERQRDAGRRVSHIMVAHGEERTEEEARQRLQEVRQRLESGEEFASLAAEYSDDETTADSEGDLGYINRGFFGEAFEDAAFSLEQGEVSDIVETDNGFHLIKVTDFDLPPFEEMRDELREQLAMDRALDRFNEKAQRLIDESFAAEDLASVAEDLDLELQQSDWVSRGAVDGVLAEPGVMAAAFEPDVLNEGYNSEVIELDEQRRMVLRVADHREAATLPLEEVQEEVRRQVAVQKTREALRERAQRLVEALRSDDPPELDWQRADGVSRQQDGDIPEPVLRTAFRLPKPDGETVYGQTADGQDIVLIALTDVAQGEQASDSQITAFAAQLVERLRAQAAVQGLLEDLRAEAEIERL
ncbi:peptidyl-prolyl cis-trans isomerase D [Modicisalibacter ilicicola DSM 19980]|uniref:Periplasmic chaperone PpiD n=1 Tax=Modicisalibacter ilicicola DSM 19980 TaxID=1121942 RepID=A0A1M4Z2D9_9GAMM|nr:SurA N-terminal domain-containing protein [Halomonas ilicicola]SHF11967.1 peptidyl-prolyl cis-trans isomerase D [Halomonas ilicicola DSM 19980]